MKNTKGHKQDEERKLIRYSVWDNHTEKLIIIDGTGPECAEAMGISYTGSFLPYLTRIKKGRPCRWTIERVFTDQMDKLDQDDPDD